MKPYKIRGHHIEIIYNFQSDYDFGIHNFTYRKLSCYGEKFAKKTIELLRKILNDPNTMIEVVADYDSICQLCPHDVRKRCENPEDLAKKIADKAYSGSPTLEVAHDKAWLELLDLKANSIITISSLIELFKEKIISHSR